MQMAHCDLPCRRKIRCRSFARVSKNGTWSDTRSLLTEHFRPSRKAYGGGCPNILYSVYAARMDRLKGSGYQIGHLEKAAREDDGLLENLLGISKSRGFEPLAFWQDP